MPTVHKSNEEMRRLYNSTLWGSAWFSWYDFSRYSSVLLVGDVSDIAYQEANRLFARVCKYGEYACDDDMKFSVILVFGGYNRKNNEILLQKIKKLLSADGVMLWAADNKLGTRFLCGDKHLGNEGEYFTLSTWKKMFAKVDIKLTGIYYLMPDWHMVKRLYAKEPNKIDKDCLHYTVPQNIIKDEVELLEDVIADKIFSKMTNAFLFEYRRDNKKSNLLEIQFSPTKGRKDSSALYLYPDKVVKSSLYDGGSVRHIYDNGQKLHTMGIKIVEQRYCKQKLIMPYIKARLVSKVMAETAKKSVPDFHAMLEKFWQCILQSAENANNKSPIKNIESKKILQKAYIDMVPTNAFYVNGDYVFFDQEYCYENYPAEYVMFRALLVLYNAELELENIVRLEEVKKWFRMEHSWQYFYDYEVNVLQHELLNWNIYGRYYQNNNFNQVALRKNCNIISHIDEFYEDNLFKNIENKKIILFGAGVYCDRYMEKYGKDYSPTYIVDNDANKWHKYKMGIEILPPSILETEKENDLRIIVCARDSKSIEKQIKCIGIKDYRVF